MLEDLATSFVSVQEGLSIRQGVTPDAVPDQLLGMLLLPIILLMTRPSGDEQTVDDWLTAHAPQWA